MKRSIAFAWLAFLLIAGNAESLTIPRGRELLTNIPSRLASVEVANTFPNLAQSSQIVVGEQVTTVITVRNGHSSPVNVTYISGSINSAKSYGIFLHNLTTIPYFSEIPEDGERSFEYTLATPPNMPPRQFLIALTLFYETPSQKKYAQTFFNSTVEVIEADKLIDTEALFLSLTLLAIAAAVGYAVYSSLRDRTWFKDISKKATKKSMPASVKEDEDAVDKSDYLIGTPHALLQRKKVAKKAK